MHIYQTSLLLRWLTWKNMKAGNYNNRSGECNYLIICIYSEFSSVFSPFFCFAFYLASFMHISSVHSSSSLVSTRSRGQLPSVNPWKKPQEVYKDDRGTTFILDYYSSHGGHLYTTFKMVSCSILNIRNEMEENLRCCVFHYKFK